MEYVEKSVRELAENTLNMVDNMKADCVREEIIRDLETSFNLFLNQEKIIRPNPGEEQLQIIIKRGDYVRAYRDGVLNVQGRSMNDLVLAFCRFIDLSPLEIAENCKVIEDQYQTLRATTEAKSS